MKVVVQIEEAQAILAGAVCRSQFPSPAYKLPGIGDGGLQRKASFVVIPQVEVALAQERLCAPVRPFSLCRPALREKAEELFSLAEEHGFTHFRAGATLLRGWTLLAQGGGAEGLSQICQGLEAVRATGTGLTVPGWRIIGAGAHSTYTKLRED
jgi:hypothetical protein